MKDYTDKFISQTREYFQKGQQNNNLLAIVNKAKFYGFGKNESLSLIKNQWIGDFTSSDENSFLRAWDKVKVESTITDFKNETIDDKIKKADSILASEKEKNNKTTLLSHILSLPAQNFQKYKFEYEGTSKDLLKWFDKNDCIWIGRSVQDDGTGNNFKDVLSFAKSNKRLELYSYMCFNTFNLEDLKRSDTFVKKFRYFLVESDSLDVELQGNFIFDMIENGLPIKSVIFSGGKSFHTLFYLPTNISNLDDYNDYMDKIYGILKSFGDVFDTKTKNASRLTRSPFGTYDKPGENEGNDQTCIYVNEKLTFDGDAYLSLKRYFENIGITFELNKSEDEIEEKNILRYVDRNIIFDAWRHGSKYFALVKSFNKDDKDKKKIETFSSATPFYDYCLQYINPKFADVFEGNKKLFMELNVRFKEDFFKPCLANEISVKADYINIFKPGFLCKAINDKIVQSELNEPLKKLIKNIFGDDKKTMKWTLKWMWTYMHDFKKMITAPVFWGGQGIGKSMIAEAFGAAIGSCKSPKQNQVEDIRFNAWVRNAVLILDEVSCGTKKDGKAFGDYLKGLISQSSQSIELKGIDTSDDTVINNCFIFTSNVSSNLPPVFMEEDDRRFTIIRNDEAENLQNLWSREDFDRWDDLTYQKILMKWIYNLECDKWNDIDIKRGLDSNWKKEIKDLSKTDTELVAEEFCEDHKGQGFISCADIKNELNSQYSNVILGRRFWNCLRSLGVEPKIKGIKQYDGTTKSFKGYDF